MSEYLSRVLRATGGHAAPAEVLEETVPEGYHRMPDGTLMKDSDHENEAALEKTADDPCWDGYIQLGMKMQKGKLVPNCVPAKSGSASVEDVLSVLDDAETVDDIAPILISYAIVDGYNYDLGRSVNSIQVNEILASATSPEDAVLDVLSFVELAHRNEVYESALDFIPLLASGHPRARIGLVSTNDRKQALSEWHAADRSLSSTVREAVRSYYAEERGTIESTYASMKLDALMASGELDALTAAFKMSFAKRSAMSKILAAIRRRDRKGRFAEEFGRLKGFFSRKDGTDFSAVGQIVGATEGTNDFQVEYKGNADIPDGIYTIAADKSENVSAYLPARAVKDLPQRDAAPLSDSEKADAIPLDDFLATKMDAPSGWKAIKNEQGKTTGYQSDSGKILTLGNPDAAKAEEISNGDTPAFGVGENETFDPEAPIHTLKDADGNVLAYAQDWATAQKANIYTGLDDAPEGAANKPSTVERGKYTPDEIADGYQFSKDNDGQWSNETGEATYVVTENKGKYTVSEVTGSDGSGINTKESDLETFDNPEDAFDYASEQAGTSWDQDWVNEMESDRLDKMAETYNFDRTKDGYTREAGFGGTYEVVENKDGTADLETKYDDGNQDTQKFDSVEEALKWVSDYENDDRGDAPAKKDAAPETQVDPADNYTPEELALGYGFSKNPDGSYEAFDTTEDGANINVSESRGKWYVTELGGSAPDNFTEKELGEFDSPEEAFDYANDQLASPSIFDKDTAESERPDNSGSDSIDKLAKDNGFDKTTNGYSAQSGEGGTYEIYKDGKDGWVLENRYSDGNSDTENFDTPEAAFEEVAKREGNSSDAASTSEVEQLASDLDADDRSYLYSGDELNIYLDEFNSTTNPDTAAESAAAVHTMADIIDDPELSARVRKLANDLDNQLKDKFGVAAAAKVIDGNSIYDADGASSAINDDRDMFFETDADVIADLVDSNDGYGDSRSEGAQVSVREVDGKWVATVEYDRDSEEFTSDDRDEAIAQAAAAAADYNSDVRPSAYADELDLQAEIDSAKTDADAAALATRLDEIADALDAHRGDPRISQGMREYAERIRNMLDNADNADNADSLPNLRDFPTKEELFSQPREVTGPLQDEFRIAFVDLRVNNPAKFSELVDRAFADQKLGDNWFNTKEDVFEEPRKWASGLLSWAQTQPDYKEIIDSFDLEGARAERIRRQEAFEASRRPADNVDLDQDASSGYDLETFDSLPTEKKDEVKKKFRKAFVDFAVAKIRELDRIVRDALDNGAWDFGVGDPGDVTEEPWKWSPNFLRWALSQDPEKAKEILDKFGFTPDFSVAQGSEDSLPSRRPAAPVQDADPKFFRMLAEKSPLSSSINPSVDPDSVDAPVGEGSTDDKKSVTSNQAAVNKVLAGMLEAIESGDAMPWRQPFTDDPAIAGANLPRNPVTKHIYSGLNSMVLRWTAGQRGYTDGRWLTYKGAQGLGGNVRKGEKGTFILKPQMIPMKDKDGKPVLDGAGKERKFVVFNTIAVFNVAQIDGLNLPDEKKNESILEAKTPLEAQNFVIDRYMKSMEALGLKVPEINYTYVGKYGSHSSSPNWSPLMDKITLPTLEQFNSPEEIFDTLMHEMAHSTGHASRLDRTDLTKDYGNPDGVARAREELIAEISSAILGQMFGIENTLDNSAAYVQSWLQRLQSNPNEVVNATKEAQKVVDYMLGMHIGDWSPVDGYSSKGGSN